MALSISNEQKLASHSRLGRGVYTLFSQSTLTELTGFTYRGNVGVSFSPHTLRDAVPPQVSLIIGNFYRSRVFKMQERSRTGEAAEPNVSQEEAMSIHKSKKCNHSLDSTSP